MLRNGLRHYDDIMKIIGTLDHKDYNTGIYYICTADGRLLKVADLVEDDMKDHNMVQEHLQKMKRPEDMDIIIALRTVKERNDNAAQYHLGAVLEHVK